MTTEQISSQSNQREPQVVRVMPRSGSGDGTAPLRSSPVETLHRVLFIAGAVLLPLGLAVIGFGWYGTAHTPYEFDQMSYLVSSIFGLGVTFAGGFLYFGSWLAKIAAEQKDAQRHLSDRLVALTGTTARAELRSKAATALVLAGSGKTLHREDCGLIASRDDLRPAPEDAQELVPCRVCQPANA